MYLMALAATPTLAQRVSGQDLGPNGLTSGAGVV